MQELVSSLVYTPNWRNRRFVVWTLAIPLALFGYFVPYCHLVRIHRRILFVIISKASMKGPKPPLQ